MLLLGTPFPLVLLVQNDLSFLLITARKLPDRDVLPLPSQLFQPVLPYVGVHRIFVSCPLPHLALRSIFPLSCLVVSHQPADGMPSASIHVFSLVSS